MPNATRVAKTFSLDRELLQRIERGKGPVSTSERVNQLLKQGLESERQQALHREAAEFFGVEADRTERRAFQSASLRSLSRE